MSAMDSITPSENEINFPMQCYRYESRRRDRGQSPKSLSPDSESLKSQSPRSGRRKEKKNAEVDSRGCCYPECHTDKSKCPKKGKCFVCRDVATIVDGLRCNGTKVAKSIYSYFADMMSLYYSMYLRLTGREIDPCVDTRFKELLVCFFKSSWGFGRDFVALFVALMRELLPYCKVHYKKLKKSKKSKR